MERWPSGRWQLTANQLVRVTGPGGSNPPLSAIDFKTAFDGTKLSVICGNGIRSELPPKKQLLTVFLEKSGIAGRQAVRGAYAVRERQSRADEGGESPLKDFSVMKFSSFMDSDYIILGF